MGAVFFRNRKCDWKAEIDAEIQVKPMLVCLENCVGAVCFLKQKARREAEKTEYQATMQSPMSVRRGFCFLK